jgi:hypothetical protein
MGAAIVLIAMTVWIVVGLAMSAEYLIVVRDPGFLTLSGMWLVDHPHTDIPALGAIEAAALQPNMLPDAAQAWNVRGDTVQPQGAKMLPATIAIGGWFAGQTGVLAANVFIGAAGILAVYALGRRFVGPLAALVPAGVLGLSVAHIGLSRSPYSEPLTLMLIVAGVLWAWRGIADHKVLPLIAGGIASGATTLVRIDGASFALGALVGVVVALALSDAPARWRQRAAISFAAAQGLTVWLGYASLWRWSEEYMARLEGRASALIMVYAAIVVAVVVWATTWGPMLRGDRVLRWPAVRLGKAGGLVAGAVVSMGLVVLASRPLWTTVHRGTEDPDHRFANGVVEGFQRAAGDDVDGTRTYAEHTLTWVSYYLTWPVVALGIVGFGIITYRMLRHDRGWAVFLGAILAPTLLYLWTPAIIPDQLWAIRRFESATLPGFALAATVAAWHLASRWRAAAHVATAKRVVAAVLILAPVTAWVSYVPDDEFPVTAAAPVFTREMAGARAEMDSLCDLADGRPVVLAGTSSHFGSIRVTCDVPVVLALVAPTPETLVAMTDAWGLAPVVLTRSPEWFEWTSPDPAPAFTATSTQANYALQRIPGVTFTRTHHWHAGLVTDTGELTRLPLPTASAP